MHSTRIRVLRRIPALALATALALGVIACADDEPPEAEPSAPPIGEGPGETASASPSPSPSSTPEPSPSPTLGLTVEQAQEIITEIQQRTNDVRVDLINRDRTVDEVQSDLGAVLTDPRLESFLNGQEQIEQLGLTDQFASPPGANIVTVNAMSINRPSCVVLEATSDVRPIWQDPPPVEINPVSDAYIALVADPEAPLGWRESNRVLAVEGETSPSLAEAECDG